MKSLFILLFFFLSQGALAKGLPETPKEHQVMDKKSFEALDKSLYKIVAQKMQPQIDRFVKTEVHLNQQNSNGDTLAHLVIRYGYPIDILKFQARVLNDKNFNINTQNKQGQTPLHLMALMGRSLNINDFIAMGVDPSQKDNNGKLPLNLTRLSSIRKPLLKAMDEQEEYKKIQRLLKRETTTAMTLKKSKLNFNAKYLGYTFFQNAARKGDLKTFRMGMRAGLSPSDITVKDSLFLLNLILREDHKVAEDMIKLLWEADPRSAFEKVRGLAMLTNFELSVKNLKRLGELGIDLNAQNENKETVLETLKGLPEEPRLKEALNTKVSPVETPEEGQKISVQKLRDFMRRGGDVNTRNSSGDTVIDLASRYGYIKFLQSLNFKEQNYNHNITNKGQTPLHVAGKNRQAEAVQELVTMGFNPMQTDKNLQNYIHYLAQYKFKNKDEAKKFFPDSQWRKVYSNLVFHQADKEGYTPFLNAARYANVELMEALVEMGVDPRSEASVSDITRMTALHYVIMSPQLEKNPQALDYVLSLKIDVNAKDRLGKTALMYLAQRKEGYKFMKKLLQSGADLGLLDKEGQTAYVYALKEEYKKNIKFLNEVDPRSEHEKVNELIYLAQITVEDLKRSGLNMDAKDERGQTPLHLVMEQGIEIIKKLIDAGAKSNVKDKLGNTALHALATTFSLERKDYELIVRSLIRKGWDINSQNKKGETPVMKAIQHGVFESGRIFLEVLGVDLTIQDKEGRTAYMHALKGGNPEIIRFLERMDRRSDYIKVTELINSKLVSIEEFKRSGLNLEVTDYRGDTAFLRAVIGSRLKDMKTLVEVGANPKALTIREGQNAFHFLAQFDLKDAEKIANYLIDKGVSVNVLDFEGQTPLRLAIKNNKTVIMKKLIEAGADFFIEDYIYALEKKQGEVIELLSKFHEKLHNGKSVLHVLIAKNDLDSFKKLVEAGADIERPDKEGRTPLHEAVLLEKPEFVTFLIELGADRYALDNNEKTPFQYAIRRDSNEKIIEIFFSKINKKNKDDERDRLGNTLLHQATKAGNSDIINRLRQLGAYAGFLNDKGFLPIHYSLPLFKVSDNQKTNETNQKAFEWLISHQEASKKKVIWDGKKDPNKEGQNLLMWAVQSENIRFMEIIIQEAGRLPEVFKATDKKGRTAYMHALKGGNPYVIQFLEEMDPRSEFERLKETLQSGLITAEDFEKSNLNKNAVDKNRNNLWHYAMDKNPFNKEEVRLLFDIGVDVNARNSVKETPIHRFILNSHKASPDADYEMKQYADLIEAFKKAGADINAKNFEGQTPLILAIINKEEAKALVLLEAGVDLKIRDERSKTALNYAMELKNENIIKQIQRVKRKIFFSGVGKYFSFGVQKKNIQNTEGVRVAMPLSSKEQEKINKECGASFSK